ncbi:MAG: hypothetical protein KF760_21655 [Candidatus Eremiobacteraeota bacterium]|nr:hypothetical protein [Candidatus Eremiobacteraeota bacterium]MCW5872671.1 hypothetical protein [Candidatus Eremiobacteraeota bacterium]
MSSMVEVLVALSLFVLAFGTVVSPLQMSHRNALECSERMQALALANDLIEQQRGLPFDKIVNTAGTRDIYSYTLTVKKQPNLRVLQLQLRWGDHKALDYGTMISGEEP